MKKGLLILSACLLAAFSFGGCNAKKVADEVIVPSATPPSEPKASAAAVEVKPYWQFANALLKSTAKEAEQENLLISPSSAYFVLSMGANGAAGETLKDFEKVLGQPLDALNTNNERLIKALEESSSEDKVSTANGLWIKNTLKPSADFLKASKDYYSAEVFNSDFTDAMEQVNAWVAQKTENKIPEMLSEPPTEEVMLLINALYFKGSWRENFSPEKTAERSFYKEDGTQLQVPFMNREFDYAYYIKSDTAEGIKLYYQGGQSFVALRPADGKSIGDFVKSMEADTVTTLIEKGEGKKVNLFLPKFEVDADLSMEDALSEMGLGQIFSDRADFSNMVQDSTPLKVSKVLQKTTINLDENGTEAAAATLLGVMEMALPLQEEQEPIELVMDKPFVYGILDENNLPLFLGVLNIPVN